MTKKDENARRTSEWEDFTEEYEYEKIFYDSVREALDIAEPRIQEMGGQVFSVEQAELRQ